MPKISLPSSPSDRVAARARALLVVLSICCGPLWAGESSLDAGRDAAGGATAAAGLTEAALELTARGYQTELPQAKPNAPSGWRIGAGLGYIAWIAIFGIIVVVVVLLAAWLVQERQRSRYAAGAGTAAGVRRPRKPGESHEDPLLLAEQGWYGEAIHALLQSAIRIVAKRSKVAVEPHLTSRELLRRLPLEPSTRAAMTELVRAVEVSHFGGVSAGPDDFSRCLESFQRTTGEARA